MESSIDLLPYTVLIVESNDALRASAQERISTRCFTQEATSIEDAKELFKIVPIHVVMIRDNQPDGDGIELCTWIAETFPETVRVLYGDSPTLEGALRAINAGYARFYLSGPWDLDAMFPYIEKAIALYNVSAGNAAQIEQLRAANHLLERKVEQNTRELVALNEELRIVLDEMQTLTVMDEQTGLYNRRAMMDKLEEAVKQANRYKTSLAALSCDIDGFKRLNDIYGPEDCDELLHEIAIRIRGSIRDVDVACRAGGDEFLIILPHTNSAQANVVAQRLHRMLIEKPYKIANEEINLQLHFGIAEMTSSVKSATILFQRTEEAQYLAVSQGLTPPIAIFPDEENASPDTVAPNTGRRPE